MASIANLKKLPPDPLLGIMAAYREDDRAGKVDLGVGVFKTADGLTPILPSVKAAEEVLMRLETTKVYEGPQGNPNFGPAIAQLAYGGERGALAEGRVVAFAAPGGCGGLGLSANFVAKLNPAATVWLSAPSWPNHAHVCQQAGLKSEGYTYKLGADGGVDLESMLADLAAAKTGDAILIQGPCHNPTGIDLSDAQWSAVAALCNEKNLFPIIDIAYHGFSRGLDDDLSGVQAFLASVPEALVCYSCSKNFGLYRERAGALLVQGETPEAADIARTHIASIARATYSMPPSHGPGIVAVILGDADLTQQWRRDVDDMRGRLISLRTGFADALDAAGKAAAGAALKQQNGMFSMLPIQAGSEAMLRDKFAIYMPGSGRINIAGLPEDRLDEVAQKIATAL